MKIMTVLPRNLSPIIRGITILTLLIFFPEVGFAAQGDSYGNCDAPLNNYKCYDARETPYCPGTGLEYARGWCSGSLTVKCCAPSGTPEGKRTGGPGLEVQKAPPPANLKTRDFQLFLEGSLLCGYKVVSNSKVTKESKFPCDSWATITVGPTGDCRDEGTDTCTVINDGGYLERQKTYTFSIQFEKAKPKTFGTCRKYTSSRCMRENECKDSGGTPIKGYCPGTPRNIKCCIYQVTEASAPVSTSFIFEKTKEKTLSNMGELDNKLNLIKQRHNVRIIIEIVDEIPQNTEENLRNKFHLLYKIDEDSKTGIGMILMYGKAKNVWRGLGFKDCRLNTDLLRKIISDDSISKNIEQKNYNEAFSNLITLLEGAINKRIQEGSLCKESTETEPSCEEQCDSFSLGPINSCNREKCVNIDGCIWNNNKCDNICNEKKDTEVVVIKRDENCANAETCPDLYLCKNGKILDGYPIKASSGANLGNKIRRGDKRTPEGTFEILEKIQVVESAGAFKYLDEQGAEVQPKCNLEPSATGIRDYWMHFSYPDRENAANNDDPRGSCIGIHGSALDRQYTLGCVKVVETDKIRSIFNNVKVSTPVTIKDPYAVERAARAGTRLPITGSAVGDPDDEFSKTCKAVCSGLFSSALYSIGGTTLVDCPGRCSKLGCFWENEKCVPVLSICPLTSRTKIKEVVIVSSVNGGLPSDENKIVAKNDRVKLIAIVRVEDAKSGEWFSDAFENSWEATIKGRKVIVKPLGFSSTVKWFSIEPEGAHLEWNSVDLIKANCFMPQKGPECEVCPDVDAGDLNYCWYQNLKSNQLWYKGADLIRYFQKQLATGWSLDADAEVGTHRYRAEITLNGVTVSSPGETDDSRPHKLKEQYYNKGITGDVHRISRRSDFDVTCPEPFKGSEGCKLMSYLDSYSNVPWIWGATAEQRNSYVGFDCAELPAGAYTQMTGKKIVDITAHGLAVGSATKPVISQRLWFDKNGNTVDASGKRVTVKIGMGENELHIGDLLLLDYSSNNAYDHTTIFLGDKNGNGILDWNDEITTSCHWIKETIVKKTIESESIWESFLKFCGLKKDVNWEEKHLNVEGICDMNIEEELKKKLNIAWVIRRFR